MRIFFLETVALEWLPRGDKRVCLRHQPEKGDLVFVRLLQPLETSRACPVPLLVERVDGPDESALFCVLLKPFQTPQSGGREPLRETVEGGPVAAEPGAGDRWRSDARLGVHPI